MPVSLAYPTARADRDAYVLDRRPPKSPRDPWTSPDPPVEDELAADGSLARTATIFLTGRECPWRCVMCDLWRHTIAGDTPPGAIPAQINDARLRLNQPSATQLKLYNASSFFDPRAVPEADYPAIAAALDGLSLVIVESHPALVGRCVDRWLDATASASVAPPGLEVAMGLETAHPGALERLNKRMTVGQFAAAAGALLRRGIAVRAFVLLAPPFVAPDQQLPWLLASVDVAFDAGASVVSMIPTRGGNGAMEALESAGSFRRPTLDEIERGFDAVLTASGDRGRLFVDLWDLERLSTCTRCFGARRQRLDEMNRRQRVLSPVPCQHAP